MFEAARGIQINREKGSEMLEKKMERKGEKESERERFAKRA